MDDISLGGEVSELEGRAVYENDRGKQLWGSPKAKESLASEVMKSFAERALGGSKLPGVSSAPRHQSSACTRECTSGEWGSQWDQVLSQFGLQVQVRFQCSGINPAESPPWPRHKANTEWLRAVSVQSNGSHD